MWLLVYGNEASSETSWQGEKAIWADMTGFKVVRDWQENQQRQPRADYGKQSAISVKDNANGEAKQWIIEGIMVIKWRSADQKCAHTMVKFFKKEEKIFLFFPVAKRFGQDSICFVCFLGLRREFLPGT